MARKIPRYKLREGPTSSEIIKIIRNSYWMYAQADIDLKTVIEADMEKQNFSWAGRPYYVDIKYICKTCNCEFTFSSKEQKVWYEDYGIYIDSYPKNCLACRKELRKSKEAKERYDSHKSENDGDLNQHEAQELLELIDALFSKPYSEKMLSRYNRLSKIADPENNA